MSAGSRGFKLRCCGRERGVVYVDTPHHGPYGILFCSRCDYAHDDAGGPPIEHRVRDLDQSP